MRRDPTPAEDILWQQLRRRELGFRFRRQEPIGPYICDFVCRARHLIIEVDGESHDDPEADRARDRALRAMGYRVIRFWDGEIYQDPDAMADYLWHQLHREDRE